MEEYAGSLFYDLANPCYRSRFIPTGNVAEDSYLLFWHLTWRILVFVKKVVMRRGGGNTFLQVDVVQHSGCNIPAKQKDIFLCGIDVNVKSNQGKVISIPFLQCGQGILLAEEICDQDSQVSGLFYEIHDMFILDVRKVC